MENDILKNAQDQVGFASKWAAKVSAEEYKALTMYYPSLSTQKRTIPQCSSKMTEKMLFGAFISTEEYLASVPAEVLKKYNLDAK